MYNLKFNWNAFQTDKADVYVKNSKSGQRLEIGHGYGRAYDKHLFDNRLDVKKVLEIGTRIGSIDLWLNYFPNAKVYGIDLVNPNVEHERFTFEEVDQSNRQEIRKFFENHGSDFDVIVDDGLHAAFEQQISFDECFLKLKDGGFYVIEDMHCQRQEEEGGPHHRPTINTNMDTYKMIEQIIKTQTTDCSILENKNQICESIQSVDVEYARNCRWITMSKPSEVIFLKRK